ncbi:MAG TPA: hypothetical protein VM144_14090 [Aestuariivirga sp.]|nr:hypothetical protein [Aestuariivirga sp.]
MLSILTLLGGCGLVIVGCIVMLVRQDRINAGKYEWQPDLSHNVIENMFRGSKYGGGHLHMTKLPKSQEQLEEEKHAYLKERKSYD